MWRGGKRKRIEGEEEGNFRHASANKRVGPHPREGKRKKRKEEWLLWGEEQKHSRDNMEKRINDPTH